ncbi:hypothetical protein LPJGGPFB_02519 [Ensifer adhaerens]|uniref:HEPN domain-containing protein n=1 Tax=Ensifer adhaerens TaxID=106592 RepID=UPI0015682102|nr:HEPN domain-containing protein [Ensifer adhaerens]NRP19265.1 hypothetical protein [Ensifer adhaerens]
MPAQVLQLYASQLSKLAEIIERTEQRVLSEPPDRLFADNINFYTKSYLINLCAITEACLKDTAMVIVRTMSQRLSSTNVSNNIIAWSVHRDGFDGKKHSKYDRFLLNIDEKAVSEKLSANPWKAIKLFELLGCDISASGDFDAVKGIVGAVVEKRNNIVHHNDEANDVSLTDVRNYISFFVKYIESISGSAKELIGA